LLDFVSPDEFLLSFSMTENKANLIKFQDNCHKIFCYRLVTPPTQNGKEAIFSCKLIGSPTA